MEDPADYVLQIGQILRYPRAQEDPGSRIGDHVNFRWLGAYPGAGGFQMESGINTPAAVLAKDGVARRPAIIVSSSPHKRGSSETPWQDYFDPDNGHIRYFGDNKDPGKDPAQALGNKALLRAFYSAHSHDRQVRSGTPPLLFFERTKKGFAAFQGFGVIRSVDLVTQWDNRNLRSFTNYAFDFVVFRMDAEHEVFDWQWIRARRDTDLTLEEADRLAPHSWRQWLERGANYLDLARRRVSKISVENVGSQKPAPGSEIEHVLQQIYTYFDGRKHKFEALAEIVAERVIDPDGQRYEKGWITSAGGDGGADFVASLRLGSDFAATKIVVLGQAKCVALDSPTHGNHIARTVARLRRGWIGVFVTTSYFSVPVQQEVIEDRYPILLIHGKRVAEEVLRIVHQDKRFADVHDFLDSVTEQYEKRVQQRQPEEILRPMGTVILPDQV